MTAKDTKEKLLEAIDQLLELGPVTTNPGGRERAILFLAEAYAWLMAPNQAHGGSSSPKT